MNTQEIFKDEVLKWVEKGISKAQIAKWLGISRANLDRKLRFNHKIDADIWLRFHAVKSQLEKKGIYTK